MKNKRKIHKGLRRFYNKGDSTDCIFNTNEKADSDSRKKLFKKQREKYGFDERETWSMDYTTITWLYTHLERYLAWAGKVIVIEGNNAYHFITKVVKRDKNNNFVFDVVKDDNQNIDGIELRLVERELSQKEIIEEIMLYFEPYLKGHNSLEERLLSSELAKEGMRIYGEILPALWW